MGKVYMTGGSGGADSDELTANAADVLAGKTAVTHDSDGEPVAGTLALTGDAQAADVRSGKSFYNTDPKSAVAGTMSEMAGKTVTPTEAAQNNVVPANTFVTGAVNVGAVSSTYVGTGVTRKAAATYNPGTQAQTINKGQYLDGDQTIAAVSNLSAGNVRKGATVGGVAGSYTGTGTATAADVRSGKTFSSNTLQGASGTIPDMAQGNITPTEASQVVNCAGKYMTQNFTVNAIPSAYKKTGSSTSFFELGGRVDYERSTSNLPYLQHPPQINDNVKDIMKCQEGLSWSHGTILDSYAAGHHSGRKWQAIFLRPLLSSGASSVTVTAKTNWNTTGSGNSEKNRYMTGSGRLRIAGFNDDGIIKCVDDGGYYFSEKVIEQDDNGNWEFRSGSSNKAVTMEVSADMKAYKWIMVYVLYELGTSDSSVVSFSMTDTAVTAATYTT